MKNFQLLAVFCFIACVAMLFTKNNAHAVQSINVQTFTPSTSDEFVLIEDAYRPTWPKTATTYFGANYNWMRDPLIAADADLTGRVATLINAVHTFNGLVGFKVASRMAVFADLPINIMSYPDGTTKSSLGDFRTLAKIRLTPDDMDFAVAFIPEIRWPTGDPANFSSDSSVVLSGKLTAEREFKNVILAGNLGLISAPNSRYFDVDMTKRWYLGLGALFPLTEQWGLNLEYQNQITIPQNPYLNPNELYGGVRYVMNESVVGTAGGSVGSVTGPTGQDIRIVLGLRWTLYKEEDKPYVPPPAPPPPPPVAQKPLPAPVPLAVFTATRIEILKPIMFEHDSAELIPESKEVLNEVAAVMKRNDKKFTKILVDGHTNELGTDKYNLDLSLRRAKSVKKYLVDEQKVAPKRLEARGFGKRKPKVPATNLDAEDINRRVEFIVVK